MVVVLFVVGAVASEEFVVIDPDGLFRHVGPSQLDRASLRATRMITENLRVGSNLAGPEGNGRLRAVLRTRVGRSAERFVARWGFAERQIDVHNTVVLAFFVVVVFEVFLVVGRRGSDRLPFQGRPVEHVMVVVVGSLVLRGGITVAASAPVGKVELEQERVDVGQ